MEDNATKAGGVKTGGQPESREQDLPVSRPETVRQESSNSVPPDWHEMQPPTRPRT